MPLNNGGSDPQKKKVVIDTTGNEIVEQEDADRNDESMLKNSLDDDIASRRKEDLTGTKKEVLVSNISMPFEDLRKDMANVFQTTKGIGNVFFRVYVDLGIGEVKIEFCGITEHNTMISTGKGKLKEAGANFPLGSR